MFVFYYYYYSIVMNFLFDFFRSLALIMWVKESFQLETVQLCLPSNQLTSIASMNFFFLFSCYSPILTVFFFFFFFFFRCTHFSNFGLLFGNESNEDWTIWRILSLAFWLGVWLLMVIFFALLQSSRFRVLTGLETQGEKLTRVLGVEDKSVSLD